ncbi:hypothetical protein Tco_1522305 [Tanacetum coccineum]
MGTDYPRLGDLGQIPVMPAPVISISLDLSDESVGSSIPSTYGFTFSVFDDSESDTEMPERHVSSTPHDAMLARWRSRVASCSSSPATSTPEIRTTPIPPAPSAIDIPIGRLYHTHPGGPCRALTTRKSVRPLPSHRLALRYTSHHLDRFTSGSSSDHSSSNHPSADHSLADHTSGHPTSDRSLSRHSSPPLPLKSLPSDSSATTLDRHSHSPSHSMGPSRKRCRYLTNVVPSSIPALGALVPTRVDLLLPRKRFRDSISPKDSVEEDIKADVLADIEADTMAVEVAAIAKDFFPHSHQIRDEGKVESSDRGTMKIGVDMVAGIDILDGMLMFDDVRAFGAAFPNQKIFKKDDLHKLSRRRKAKAQGGERVRLLDHVAALERSNTRLQDTLRMESVRVDTFLRRMISMAGKLRQIHEFCYYDRMRFRRFETFAMSRWGFSSMMLGMDFSLVVELAVSSSISVNQVPSATAPGAAAGNLFWRIFPASLHLLRRVFPANLCRTPPPLRRLQQPTPSTTPSTAAAAATTPPLLYPSPPWLYPPSPSHLITMPPRRHLFQPLPPLWWAVGGGGLAAAAVDSTTNPHKEKYPDLLPLFRAWWLHRV